MCGEAEVIGLEALESLLDHGQVHQFCSLWPAVYLFIPWLST